MLREYVALSDNRSISHFRSKHNNINTERRCKFAELLAKHHKTAYQVAKDTGIAQSVLSDWKTGRSKPKADKLKILAEYFGVTIDYFYEDTTVSVQ